MEDLENTGMTLDQVDEIAERRIEKLNEAGINELEVLSKAKENLNIWNGYFNENIVRGKDDMNFVTRDQWTAIERSEFSRLFKPAMTFNKLYDAVKKIAGEQRKNKPDLLVRSLTGRATQEEITLRSDLVRTISYQSQNDLVYQTAFRSALMLGFGAFQIDIDFENPMSFNKVIRFNPITDPTRCVWDPTAVKPHKGDGNFCARNYVMSNEEFAATYPYIDNPVSYTDPYYLLDFQWETRDTIVLCDYFVKEWYPLLIYKLSNGMTVSEFEWEEMQKTIKLQKEIAANSEIEKVVEKEIPRIVDERQTQDYRVMHYRLIRNQIVDFTEWPSKQLPIIFVDGDSYWIEGRQYTKSFIHEARDAQKCVNYFNSEIAAEIKNRRREQWMGTPDNIIGYEQMWRNPELQNGILMAKPDPTTKAMPQKMQPWEISQSLVVNSQRATQDIKEILGFSETEQLQGRDVSGKARRERKMEGSMSAYVFFDNLNQAIEQAGRCVLDLLPSVYGQEERYVIISKPDGKTKPLVLNKMLPNGDIENQLTLGDFDIEIDTGPSFAVQKDIALEFLQQTIATNPQTFPLVADLWAKNLDVQFMPQMAERFKSLVPPEILAKEAGEPPPPQQPNPQEMMMQQEMQLKQQQLQERAAELKIRQEKHELEKAELMMQARELQQKLHMDGVKVNTEMKKADLDFSGKLLKIMGDLEGKKTKEIPHNEK